MQYITTGNQLHTLTNCDETKKRTLNSQIVRAKENPKLNRSEPSFRQTSGTDKPIKG